MELVKIENGQILTSSLVVAEVFSRMHKDVLKAIDNLECSKDFRERNFAPSYYTNSQNKQMPCYAITEKGFMFLAMGFTGKAAAEWKERFIFEFEKMAEMLNSKPKYDYLTNTRKLYDRFLVNKQNIPNGYFSMIEATVTMVVMPLESDGKDLVEEAMPDSSLGKGFCKFLREQKGIDTSKLPTYIHRFSDGRKVKANLYKDELLADFKRFVLVWAIGLGAKYFNEKTILLLNK